MINIMTMLFLIHYSFDEYLFFLLNLGVVAAYIAIIITNLFAYRMIPALTVFTSRKTRWATALFFLISTITRLEFSYETLNPTYDPSYTSGPYAGYVRICQIPLTNHDLSLHVIQLFAVWAMIIFLAHDLLTRFKIVSDKE